MYVKCRNAAKSKASFGLERREDRKQEGHLALVVVCHQCATKSTNSKSSSFAARTYVTNHRRCHCDVCESLVTSGRIYVATS